ncbi:MAG: single-stranded-DNA-specific exonuclease RecJ [Deltaproteobacteria bacterium]|nr:single-stranded-DNA-specific exonuclease RecJ [Deltaproteobacteria bacterium]
MVPDRVVRKWEIRRPPSGAAFSPEELGISALTARILRNRGIEQAAEARKFLFPALSDLPDPGLLRDMDRALARISRAVRERERITLFGDYDVDGTTAIALLFLFLKQAGAAVDFYLPHRLTEGYGLNLEAMRKIRAQGSSLLITADCGVSSREEIRWAKENGLDVVVTDHHEVPEELPPAEAVLNPKRRDCPYPFKHLAGVGVAFNLIIALRRAFRQEGIWTAGAPNLKEYLDLVALGTMSDIVPLKGVNRILAKVGLEQLSRSLRPGIGALKEVAGMDGLPVDSTGLGFRLAPRLNAAGRLDDSREVIRLLTAEDQASARAIASRLDAWNTERQRLEGKILAEAREMIMAAPWEGKKSLVLSSADWHPGVIGIVASRLIEEFHRPTILIALTGGRGKGSGRSIPAFSLYEGLKACRSFIEKFGGHEQAAGLVIQPERIPDFSAAFEENVAACLREEDFVPRLSIDADVHLREMNASFMAELEALAPFGAGNPEPVFSVGQLTVRDSKLVGKGHLRLRLLEGGWTGEAIGFRLGSWHPLSGERMRMAFSPQIHTYQGRRSLQLKIIDLQPSIENKGSIP